MQTEITNNFPTITYYKIVYGNITPYMMTTVYNTILQQIIN